MKILVTVASKHGATDAIGQTIAETLREEGLEVDLVPPTEVGDLEPYDGVIVGSAVYVGRWLAPARTFVERRTDELQKRPVWLFSSGPLGEDLKPVAPPTDATRLVELSGAREHKVFAGSLVREGLGLAERAVVGMVKAPYGDFRNWPAVTAWARWVAHELGASPVGNQLGAPQAV